jgi:hypothetical protein
MAETQAALWSTPLRASHSGVIFLASIQAFVENRLKNITRSRFFLKRLLPTCSELA